MIGMLRQHSTLNLIILSILLHLLLISFFSTKFLSSSILLPEKEKPYSYVASYSYSQSTLPAQLSKPNAEKLPTEQMANNLGLEPITTKTLLKSIYSTPQMVYQQYKKQEPPLHMIGEKLLDDPLLKQFGIALTAHLIYPRMAQQLNLRGVVSISLVIHSDGEITDIRLIKTSKEKILDTAALNAVQAVSPLANADIYVKEPKLLNINIVFR